MKLQLNIQTRLFLTIIGILFFFALVLYVIQNLSFKIHNDILNDAISGTLHLYTINFEKLLNDIQRQSHLLRDSINNSEKIITIKNELELQEGNIAREKSGIGLKNIYDRFKIIYKENFVFLISSKTGKGTKIIIKLPVHTVDDYKEK